MDSDKKKRKEIIYIASGLAVFSMFLPWDVLGIRSDTGWEREDYFLVLILWVYPFFNAHWNRSSNIISKILVMVAGVELFVFFDSSEVYFINDIRIGWDIGAGAYIYIVAWLVGLYGEFFYSWRSFKRKPVLQNKSKETYFSSKNRQIFEKKSIALCLILCIPSVILGGITIGYWIFVLSKSEMASVGVLIIGLLFILIPMRAILAMTLKNK